MIWHQRSKKRCVSGETSPSHWSNARSSSSGRVGDRRSICSAVMRSMQLSISERESGSRGQRPRQYSSRLSSRKSLAPTLSASSTTFTRSVETYCAPVFSQMPSPCWRDLVLPPMWSAASKTSRSWSRRRYAAVRPATPPPSTATSSRSKSAFLHVRVACATYAVARPARISRRPPVRYREPRLYQAEGKHAAVGPVEPGGAGHGGLPPVHSHRSHGGIVLCPGGPRLHHRLRDHPPDQFRPGRPVDGGRVHRLDPACLPRAGAPSHLSGPHHRLRRADDRHRSREPWHPSIRLQTAAPKITAGDPDHRARHVSVAPERR